MYGLSVLFGQDIRITNNAAFSGFPKVSEQSGNIHLVWQDERDGNNEIYYKKLDGTGAALTSDIKVTNNNAISWYPDIVRDSSASHIVWMDERDGNTEIYYTKLNNNGGTIVDDSRITNNPSDSVLPVVDIDSNGNLHLVWIDSRDGNAEVYYKKLDNSGNILVNDLRITDNSAISWFSNIAVDSSNNVHIIWTDDRDGNSEIYYTKLNSNGGTIVDDLKVTNEISDSSYPAIAINNEIHVAWVDSRNGNSEIYYKKLDADGNEIISDTRISTNTDISWFPDISVDSGNVNIVWVDGRNNNLEIYYSKLNNGIILESEQRVTFDSAESALPALANGNVRFVWVDKRDLNEEIYYKGTSSPGDPNGDGVVNSADLDLIREAIITGNNDLRFDINGDNLVNGDDLTYEVETIIGTKLGDANLDRNVDANDLAVVRTNFGFTHGWLGGNFDENYVVDANDLALVRTNFGFSAASSGSLLSSMSSLFIGDADSASNSCKDSCKNDYKINKKSCKQLTGSEGKHCLKKARLTRNNCLVRCQDGIG